MWTQDNSIKKYLEEWPFSTFLYFYKAAITHIIYTYIHFIYKITLLHWCVIYVDITYVDIKDVENELEKNI